MNTMVCKKYAGGCTVTEDFCARRHALSLSRRPQLSSSLNSDNTILAGLCADCEVGKKAFAKVGADVRLKIRNNERKKKGCKRYQSPYSYHFRGRVNKNKWI